MKKLFFVFAAGVIFAACGDSKKTSGDAGEVASASDSAATYTVNVETSTVNWAGKKVVSGAHNGTVKISEGSLAFEGGQLKAGNFTIDMTSINDADLPAGEDKTKLEGHLKSADFFHVDSFPNAKFEITSVEPLADAAAGTHTINGNLTIKGITKGISFPATVKEENGAVTATAKIEINRNEWNVLWGGTKETNKGTLSFLKDNLLSDMISFEVSLNAAK